MELISRQVLDLWNKYKPTIAVDAIEYDRELRQLLSTNLASLGTDCISRQAAMDALEDAEDAFGYLTKDWREVLEQLPPIQPAEPKKGKWIKTARWGRVYYCNQCRNYLDFDGVNAGRGSTNFCPNCGADMRGEDNDNTNHRRYFN